MPAWARWILAAIILVTVGHAGAAIYIRHGRMGLRLAGLLTAFLLLTSFLEALLEITTAAVVRHSRRLLGGGLDEARRDRSSRNDER